MNILIVSQYFWPEIFKINNLVDELSSRGNKVTILTGRPNYPSGKTFIEYKKNPKKYLSYRGSTILRVPVFNRGKNNFTLLLNYFSYILSASIFGVIRLRKKDFDVIFIYEPSPITVALPAIFISRIFRKPTILFVLDLWPESLSGVNIFNYKLVSKSLELLVGFIYNRCTLILGTSHGFVKNIQKRCKNKSKVLYFPNWVEDELLNIDYKKIKYATEIPIKKNILNLLFMGNIGVAQDFESIIKTAKILKNTLKVRWIIIGKGSKYEWLRNKILEEDLSEQFELLGSFPPEKLPAFIKHADAFLLPLRKEEIFNITIPGKLQSYLFSGKPIIGMLDGEGADIINKSKSGITCNAGDYRKHAEIIRDFININTEERAEMGNNGRQFAIENFDKKILVNYLEKLFKKSIKN